MKKTKNTESGQLCRYYRKCNCYRIQKYWSFGENAEYGIQKVGGENTEILYFCISNTEYRTKFFKHANFCSKHFEGPSKKQSWACVCFFTFYFFILIPVLLIFRYYWKWNLYRIQKYRSFWKTTEMQNTKRNFLYTPTSDEKITSLQKSPPAGL